MRKLFWAVLSWVCTMAALQASYVWEYSPGRQCEIGADLRLRVTHYDRDVLPPNLVNEEGPAVEYIRVRERIWGCFDIVDGMQLNIRAVNRWHYYSSHFRDPNNQGAPYNGPGGGKTGNTWQFPDEVVLDNLYLDIQNLFDSNWSLRLGRQDIMLGNGMVVLEGTPYDQGRSIYFDGAVATYRTEADTLTLLGLYNKYKDTAAFINDQNRRLRRGDTWLLGAYWTHQMQPSLNTDLYYLFVEIDDDREEDGEWEPAEFNHPTDENAEFHVLGARAFGTVSPQVDYSLELAKQLGERQGDADMNGMMLDARLTLKASDGTMWSPALGLEYTYFSGDDADSDDEYEGWHPVFAEYPIWREELLPIKFNGNWQNLHQYRASLVLHLRDEETYPVTLTSSWAYLRADEEDTPQQIAPSPPAPATATAGGQGSEIGHLLSAFLDVGLTSSWTVSLEAAGFFPGDYYDDGENAEWLRFQTIYSF